MGFFFSTPARRKFLKSDATELAHCVEAVRRHALARPDVGFAVWHEGRLQQQWRATVPLPNAPGAPDGSEAPSTPLDPLARRMAESLGLAYLDTGAMFRCMALKLGPGAEKLPEDELRSRCGQWTFTLSGMGQQSTLFCNGVAVRGEVRTEQVGMLAARIATVPVVRDILRQHLDALIPQLAREITQRLR